MPDRVRRYLPFAIVALAAAVPYLPTVNDYFLQDDFGVVWLFSRKAWTTFPHWFAMPWTEDIWGYVPDEVRPFPALSYQMAAAFNAGSPVANHVINIGFHAVNAMLVLWIAVYAARLEILWATVAAVIFAVLPIQAESVAWVTGRVDSMPACFYFAAFALWAHWRRRGGAVAYVAALLCCFVALFTKQNTITLGPALVLYDLVIERRPVRVSWSWMAPYLPFAAVTAGFLWLRYALFGAVAREETLTDQRLHDFLKDLSVHTKHLIFGEPGMTMSNGTAVGAVAVIAALVAIALWLRSSSAPPQVRSAAPALYFGPVWLLLGMAPILVSGYYSPRHMYLASLGWAVLVGIVFQALAAVAPTRIARAGLRLAAALVILTYAGQLTGVVRDWGVRAMVSQRALADVEREALAQPEGTLILTGAPRGSWMFALPHALKPPFTSADLTARTFVISHSDEHCCAAVLWDAYTRQAIRQWMAHDPPAPVVALYWDPRTGARSRVSDRDEPYLRPLMQVLLETGDRAALDGAITRTLTELVAPHRR